MNLKCFSFFVSRSSLPNVPFIQKSVTKPVQKLRSMNILNAGANAKSNVIIVMLNRSIEKNCVAVIVEISVKFKLVMILVEFGILVCVCVDVLWLLYNNVQPIMFLTSLIAANASLRRVMNYQVNAAKGVISQLPIPIGNG